MSFKKISTRSIGHSFGENDLPAHKWGKRYCGFWCACPWHPFAHLSMSACVRLRNNFGFAKRAGVVDGFQCGIEILIVWPYVLSLCGQFVTDNLLFFLFFFSVCWQTTYSVCLFQLHLQMTPCSRRTTFFARSAVGKLDLALAVTKIGPLVFLERRR